MQISDTHLFSDKNAKINGHSSYSNLENVFNSINSLTKKPELLIITGDLSQDCTFESYSYLHSFLDKLGIKFYLLPGNHDDLNIINKVFGFNWSRENVDYSVDFNGWFFYLIDTSIYPEAHGELTPRQLVKFEDAINKNKSKPTLIFMHHHPLKVNSWLDGMILLDSENFNSIVKKNPQVKGVLFGHIHQVFESNIDKTFYGSVPSTSYQILPQTKRFVLDVLPPGYRIIELNGNNLSTKVVRV